MYGPRSGRPVEQRQGVSLSRMSPVRRRQNFSKGDETASRCKAVDDDRSGVDMRVAGFGGKSRGGVDQTNSTAVPSVYATVSRRICRGDGMTRSDVVLHRESGRFRDSSTRGERSLRPAYAEGRTWVRTDDCDGLGYGGVRTVRGSDSIAKSRSTSSVLSGLVVGSHKRMIADCSQKGSFGLPFQDRRLAERVGPGTKVFLLDESSRDLHGVFQADSYATLDTDTNNRVYGGSSLRVRVRVANLRSALTERNYMNIIQENFYSDSEFTPGLTKEQVEKLLHAFRLIDADRNALFSLTSSRRTPVSGLTHSSPDFHSISNKIAYGKERWTGLVGTGSLGAQDIPGFSSKLPLQIHSRSVLDAFEDSADKVVENIPLSTTRLVTGSNHHSSRSKRHSLRSLSGTRPGLASVGNADHAVLKLPKGDWKEEFESRSVGYKRRSLPSCSLDGFTRDRSVSPLHSGAETTAGDLYDRTGRSSYKEGPSYDSDSRRHHGEVNLSIPLEMGHHVELSHLHGLETTPFRERVWDEDRRCPLSPSRGCSVVHRNSLRLPDYILSSSVDDFGESGQLSKVSRKELSVLPSHDKGRPLSSCFSKDKLGKIYPRAHPGPKGFPRDKPGPPRLPRRKPVAGRDGYKKETSPGGSTAPIFQIKANLNTPGRGKSDRVVRLINNTGLRPRSEGFVESGGFCPWGSGPGTPGQARKRKASVWTRITLPAKCMRPKGLKGTGVNGKGRVFSRLGPSSRSIEEVHAHKRKKVRRQGKEIAYKSKVVAGKVAMADSPDALEGEDYLADDVDTSLGTDREAEKVTCDLQGWTRKKVSVVTIDSVNGSGGCGHVDYATAKGGRRKLVRPSAVYKGVANECGWQLLEASSTLADEGFENVLPEAQPGSPSADSSDMEMANVETQEMEDGFDNPDSPVDSQENPSSPRGGGLPDFDYPMAS